MMACRLLGRCTRLLCRVSSQAPLAAAARLAPAGVLPPKVQRPVGWPGVTERFMCERNTHPETSSQLVKDLAKATVPEEVLVAWERHRGESNEAAHALLRWTAMVQKTKGNVKHHMADKRVKDMIDVINTKVTTMWNGNLIFTLKALWAMDLPPTNPTLISVQIETLWRVRRLSFKHLALLLDGGIKRKGQQDAAIVANALKHLELRWMEITDTRILTMLMSKYQDLPPSLMDKLEDKALELAPVLSVEEIRKICVSLATQNRRSVALLRVLSHHLLQKPSKDFTPALIMDIAFSYGKLSFHHPLLQRLTSEMLPHVPQLPPGDVVRFSKSLGFLKWLHIPLFDAIVMNYVANSESYSTAHLCNLLMTFARLGFLPSIGEEFFRKAHSVLETSLPDMAPLLRMEVVWSLCVLQQSKPHYLFPLTKQEHLTKLSEQSGLESTRLKSLHIAATLHLEHPGSSDSVAPLALDPVPVRAKVSPLEDSLRMNLQSLAKNQTGALRLGLDTEYGWTIDGELVVDSDNNPINRRGDETLPAGAHRIAFWALNYQHLSNNREPLGWFVMKKRHLQLAGFITVEVPYHEWLELKMDWQRQAYLKDKLAKAVAQEMAK